VKEVIQMGSHDKFNAGEWVKVDGEEKRVTSGGEFIVHVQGENDKNPVPVVVESVTKWSHK